MRPGGREARWVFLPLVVACVLAAGEAPASASDGPPYPRLANVYLHGSVDPSDVASLARWDLLVLDSVWSDAQLALLRARNPDIRTFFYVCAYCTAVPPARNDEWRMTNYVYAHTNDLWWRNVDGSVASDWPGTQMINITDRGPSGPAGNWRTFMGARLETLVGAQRLLDGVFFDNFWQGISWEQGSIIRVDSDCSPRANPAGCDGVMDPPALLDSLWNGALSSLASETRWRFDRLQRLPGGRPLAILSNGSTDYYAWLNGTMYEHFPHNRGDADRGNPHNYAWTKQMLAEPGGYLTAPFRPDPYVAPILNAGWTGTWDAPDRDGEFERHKRFTLGSALLGDGYYSLDAATAGHGALWWEPEYDHDGRGKGYLGQPTGPAVRIGSPTGVENVVNGSWETQTWGWHAQPVNAAGAYERDFAVTRSAPGAARLTLEHVEPGGSLKLYQSVPVLGGYAYTLSFWAKTDVPQMILVHLYGDGCAQNRCLDDQRFEIGVEWRKYELSFIATGNEQAGLNFFVSTPGTVWIDDVSLRGGDTTLYRRDFDNGIVLLNYTSQPRRVELRASYRRLSIAGSPVWDGRAVAFETVPPWDARILLRTAKTQETPPPQKGAATRGRRAALWPADPNPFRPGTDLRFSLERDEPVRLVIYDVAGRRVRTLASGPLRAAGDHSLRWNGDDDGGRRVSPGIYVARLQTPTFADSRKLTLLP